MHYKCSLLLLSNVYEYKSSFLPCNLSSLVLGCVDLLFTNKEQKSLDHGIFNIFVAYEVMFMTSLMVTLIVMFQF